MSADLPVLWSPAQQAWLQAMGYTVYHEQALAADMDAALQLSVARAARDAESRPAAAAPVEVKRGDTAASESVAPLPPAPRPAPRQAPVAPPAADAVARDARRPVASGSRQPSVRLPDRLQLALLRASGCNPNDPATRALMDSWPLETLRGNAAAKRALWPALRALRRKGAAQ